MLCFGLNFPRKHLTVTYLCYLRSTEDLTKAFRSIYVRGAKMFVNILIKVIFFRERICFLYSLILWQLTIRKQIVVSWNISWKSFKFPCVCNQIYRQRAHVILTHSWLWTLSERQQKHRIKFRKLRAKNCDIVLLA